MVDEDELTFSHHAENRLRDRGITTQDVAWALTRPIGDPDAGDPGTVWIHGQPAGKRVLKVCVRTNDHSYVITAVWRD